MDGIFKKVLFLSVLFVLPFFAGAEILPVYVCVISVLVAYFAGIKSGAKIRGVADFRELEVEEFARVERYIKIRQCTSLVGIVLVYCFGRIVS